MGSCRNSGKSGVEQTKSWPLSLGYLICKIGYSLLHGERICAFEVPLNNQIQDLDLEVQLNQMLDRNGTGFEVFKAFRYPTFPSSIKRGHQSPPHRIEKIKWKNAPSPGLIWNTIWIPNWFPVWILDAQWPILLNQPEESL